MRFPKVTSLLLLTLCLGLALAQDAEDSAAPKRVLKKYRVRRPVIVDDQGNVVRAGPRLRRVRVKNPRPTSAGVETSSKAPITTVTSTTSTTVSSSRAPVLRQRTLGASPNLNAIPLERQVQRVQAQPQPQAQPQTVLFEEPGVIEQVRTVPTYRQATTLANRESLLANVNYKPSRGTSNALEEERKVGTTTNYSKINDDGSFTFGYEADDGSFKEETRGVDCVVRGKYGYIDPEGVRREFEYVSGNPCDPNAPKDEEQSDEEEDSLAPSRPLLRQRVRPEISENNIQQGQQQTREERLPEDQLANFVRPVIRQRVRQNPNTPGQHGFVLRQRVRVTTPSPSTVTPTNEEEQPPLFVRQRYSPSPRPSIFQEVSQSLDDQRGGRGLFSFDDEVHRLAAISRPQDQPQPLYAQPFRQVHHHQPNPASRQVFGNAAFRQEQQASPTPTAAAPTASSGNSNFGRYRTELVYDPQSGQYTSVLVQGNQHPQQEFELSQKLRAFSDPTQSPSPSPTPTYSSPSPAPTFPSGGGAFTQIQQFGQPQIQYYHHPPAAPQGRSANPHPQPQHQQDPSQINQFLARHAYQTQPQPQPQHQHQQAATAHQNLNFIPPHLRPSEHETAEIQRQEVRELSFPRQSQGFSANSAAASNGQIDAFLRALNISL